MPYSFTQIEEDKSRLISGVFVFLILFYFFTFLVIALVAKPVFLFSAMTEASRSLVTEIPSKTFFLQWYEAVILFPIAFVVGIFHWQLSTHNLVPKTLGVLKAEPINPEDSYHKVFRNVVDEVSVATGGKKIEAVVVPTSALNAFSLSDFSGRAIIGVTEGLLARLNRAQLEAVIGHEAAHIVSGDSLSTSIISSLSEFYSGLLKGIEAVLRQGGRSRGRGGGSLFLLLMVIYVLLWLSQGINSLFRMFISRQREYRADAVAVRLTRNPLALAEALYAIAFHWRGAGLTIEQMEAIFIVSPLYQALEEKEGAVADLFGTHPPVQKRIDILIDMAHTNMESLIQGFKVFAQKPRTEVPSVSSPGSPMESRPWFVNRDGNWEGPFPLVEVVKFPWITQDTWVRSSAGGEIQMVYQVPEITGVLNGGKSDTDGPLCPRCKVNLVLSEYEGTRIHRCPLCRGSLVHENDVQRIIIREDVGFSDDVQRVAKVLQQEERLGTWKVINRDPALLYGCPLCRFPKDRMMRMFYTEVYKIEVDKCWSCSHLWFDAFELETLQYMIENATQQKRSIA